MATAIAMGRGGVEEEGCEYRGRVVWRRWAVTFISPGSVAELDRRGRSRREGGTDLVHLSGREVADGKGGRRRRGFRCVGDRDSVDCVGGGQGEARIAWAKAAIDRSNL